MLTDIELEHIAKLARLEIRPGEKERLKTDLSAILDYVAKLEEVNTKGVKDTDEGRPINQWREDISEDSGIEEAILGAAPKRKQRFFEVKGIFEE